MMRNLAYCLLFMPLAVAADTILTPQAPGIETSLSARADIIAWEGFESTDWWKAPWWLDMNSREPLTSRFTTNPTWAGATSSSVTAAAYNGSRGLKFELEEGQHYGTSMAIELPAGTQEAFLRYYIMIPEGMGKPAGKDWGFKAGPSNAGVKPTGDRLTVRSKLVELNSAGQTVTDGSGDRFKMAWYVYHLDQSTGYGETIYWDNSNARFMKGEWACIEVQVKLNTVTGSTVNRNGIIRGWLNGTLKSERTNLAWQNGTGINSIETMDAFIYTGGAALVPFQGYGYIDNVVVAKNRIGCYDDSSTPTPLATPAGITWND